MLINCYLKPEGNSLKVFEAFREGCPRPYKVRQLPDDRPCRDGDIDLTFGVGHGYLRRMLAPFGRSWLSFDKPYNRKWPEQWRLSFNNNYSSDYLMTMDCPPDRAEIEGWFAPKWRELTSDGHVLFAGSSDRAHCYFNLEFANAYALHTIQAIRELTKRYIVYRPKPTFAGAKPVLDVENVTFSFGTKRKIIEDLRGAHVLVTHSSVSCLNALLAGIPSIILGPAITGRISSHNLSDIENPYCASPREVQRLLNNLAYTQWSLEEYAAGIPQRMFFEDWFGVPCE